MRTWATAALAALAVLAWDAPSALAAAPPRHGQAAAPAPHLSGVNDTAVTVGGIVVLLVLVIFVIRRMSPRAGGRGHAGPDRGTPPGPSTDELSAQASSALVATDNAVRTSEQELGFATARCGERAAAPFLAALQTARAELSTAFTLRQQLDDDSRQDETTTRSYLAAVTAHCAEASRVLDEQSEAFDRLQALEVRAPQLVAEVDAHVVQQSARVGRSRQVLDLLAAKYTPDAVATVVTNPDQAGQRLKFAADCLAGASQELARGQSGTAVLLLQAAESGADQATDLLSGIEHREAQLTQAASALPAALREVDAEIAEAAALLAGRPEDDRAPLVARAQTLAADVRARQAAGPFDALAALRDLQQADAGLDQALASVRLAEARRERARPVLEQAMLVARSSVTTAEEFIETRRGGVGATARTRLAEAQRRFRQAIGAAQRDPEAALTEAQQADALGQQARLLAEQDVARFDHGSGTGSSGGSGGPCVLGGFGPLRGSLDSAILGGILIGSPRVAGRADSAAYDGERDGGEGGGRGGEGGRRDSDRLGRGIGPGSFGGIGTRGRHVVSASR